MSNKMKTKQLKQLKNQSQSGRSMVEMLGVLAIIAVLSIGGIIGFRLAMNYYQANQIAHEMNIMRTDAQIKIAQGTEKLTLGVPYDENKISFNNYDTAFGCKYVDENDLISDETVSCQIANAYYIELPKIPNGVCQPLARLINGMDNLIAFSVNDSEYEEGGNCQEGENDLYAVFSGETVSDLTHCERDDDCDELESTPVCDTDRHVCVECTQKEDCTQGNGGICIENKCDYCANGEIRDESSKCVECLTYENCTGKPETPQCDEISHTCKSCAEIDSNKPLWYNNKCVECITYNNCTDIEKPNCNSGTNTCERCPDTASRWDGEKCVGCNDNDDCPDGKYCDMDVEGCTNGEPYGKSRRCQVPQYTSYKISGKTYYKSKSLMDWWAAGRFCERVGEKEGKSLRRVSLTELGCDTSTCNNETDSLWKQLKDQGLNDWLWTSNEGTDCRAYIVDLEEETVLFYKKHVDGRNYETDALCVSDL